MDYDGQMTRVEERRQVQEQDCQEMEAEWRVVLELEQVWAEVLEQLWIHDV